MRTTGFAWLGLAAALLVAPAAAQELERVPAVPNDASPDAKAAWAKLDAMQLSVDFEDTPVVAAVQFIRQVSGINIVIDRRIAEERALDETRITLQVTDVSLRTALAFVCEFADLAVRWRHHVLLLTSPEHARGKPIARMYDVRDVTFQMKDFPGPEIKLEASDGSVGSALMLMGDEEDTTPTRDQIMDLLQEMMPGAWDLPGVSITTFGGAIMVRQYPEQHRQIQYIISMIRASR